MIGATEEILHSRRGSTGLDDYNRPKPGELLFTNAIPAVVQPASGSIENSTTRTVIETEYVLHIYGNIDAREGDTFHLRGEEHTLAAPARYYLPPTGFNIPEHTVLEVKRAAG